MEGIFGLFRCIIERFKILFLKVDMDMGFKEYFCVKEEVEGN